MAKLEKKHWLWQCSETSNIWKRGFPWNNSLLSIAHQSSFCHFVQEVNGIQTYLYSIDFLQVQPYRYGSSSLIAFPGYQMLLTFHTKWWMVNRGMHLIKIICWKHSLLTWDHIYIHIHVQWSNYYLSSTNMGKMNSWVIRLHIQT